MSFQQITIKEIREKYNISVFTMNNILTSPNCFPKAIRSVSRGGRGQCSYFKTKDVDNWFKANSNTLINKKNVKGIDNHAALAFITNCPNPQFYINKALNSRRKNAKRVSLIDENISASLRAEPIVQLNRAEHQITNGFFYL